MNEYDLLCRPDDLLCRPDELVGESVAVLMEEGYLPAGTPQVSNLMPGDVDSEPGESGESVFSAFVTYFAYGWEVLAINGAENKGKLFFVYVVDDRVHVALFEPDDDGDANTFERVISFPAEWEHLYDSLQLSADQNVVPDRDVREVWLRMITRAFWQERLGVVTKFIQDHAA